MVATDLSATIPVPPTATLHKGSRLHSRENCISLFCDNIDEAETNFTAWNFGHHQSLTGLWDGVVYKDEDGLLGVQLDPLPDHVNELACWWEIEDWIDTFYDCWVRKLASALQ